jgi:hypothetical protein
MGLNLPPSLLLTSEDSPASTSSSAITVDSSLKALEETSHNLGQSKHYGIKTSLKSAELICNARSSHIKGIVTAQLDTKSKSSQAEVSSLQVASSAEKRSKTSASLPVPPFPGGRVGPAIHPKHLETEKDRAEAACYHEDLQSLTFQVDRVELNTPPPQKKTAGSVIRSPVSPLGPTNTRTKKFPAGSTSRWDHRDQRTVSAPSDYRRHSRLQPERREDRVRTRVIFVALESHLTLSSKFKTSRQVADSRIQVVLRTTAEVVRDRNRSTGSQSLSEFVRKPDRTNICIICIF